MPTMSSTNRPGRNAWMERWGIPPLDQPGSMVFVTALLIQSAGNGLFFSFILIYFHEIAGLPLAQVGLAITISSAIGLVANPLAGQIVDHFGAKRMVVFSQFVKATGFTGFFLADSIPLVVLVTLIMTFGERIFWVAFPSLVTTLSRAADRDRWFAFTSAVRNAGLGAGGIAAGVVIGFAGDTGYQILLGANVVGYAIAATLLTLRAPRMDAPVRSTDHGGYRQVLRDRPAVTIAAANVVFAYCALLVYFALPVFVVETLEMPAWVVGFLFALNTVQLALGQTLVIRAVGRFRRTRILAAAGVIWITTSALFAIAIGLPRVVLIPYLTVVVVVYTFGELIHAPTASTLIVSLAPDALRGRYLAMDSMSWGAAQTIGPALFTGLLAWNGAAPWAMTALLAAGAAVLVISSESFMPAAMLRQQRD